MIRGLCRNVGLQTNQHAMRWFRVHRHSARGRAIRSTEDADDFFELDDESDGWDGHENVQEQSDKTPEQIARERRKKRIIATKIKKFYNPKEPVLLTWAARMQLKHLNKIDPIYWTPEMLANSFPISRDSVITILRSPRLPKNEAEIAKFDSKVQKTWQELKDVLKSVEEGRYKDLNDDQKWLAEFGKSILHLLPNAAGNVTVSVPPSKFAFRTQENIAEEKKPVVKPYFSSILTSYDEDRLRLKEMNGIRNFKPIDFEDKSVMTLLNDISKSQSDKKSIEGNLEQLTGDTDNSEKGPNFERNIGGNRELDGERDNNQKARYYSVNKHIRIEHEFERNADRNRELDSERQGDQRARHTSLNKHIKIDSEFDTNTNGNRELDSERQSDQRARHKSVNENDRKFERSTEGNREVDSERQSYQRVKHRSGINDHSTNFVHHGRSNLESDVSYLFDLNDENESDQRARQKSVNKYIENDNKFARNAGRNRELNREKQTDQTARSYRIKKFIENDHKFIRNAGRNRELDSERHSDGRVKHIGVNDPSISFQGKPRNCSLKQSAVTRFPFKSSNSTNNVHHERSKHESDESYLFNWNDEKDDFTNEREFQRFNLDDINLLYEENDTNIHKNQRRFTETYMEENESYPTARRNNKPRPQRTVSDIDFANERELQGFNLNDIDVLYKENDINTLQNQRHFNERDMQETNSPPTQKRNNKPHPQRSVSDIVQRNFKRLSKYDTDSDDKWLERFPGQTTNARSEINKDRKLSKSKLKKTVNSDNYVGVEEPYVKITPLFEDE